MTNNGNLIMGFNAVSCSKFKRLNLEIANRSFETISEHAGIRNSDSESKLFLRH